MVKLISLSSPDYFVELLLAGAVAMNHGFSESGGKNYSKTFAMLSRKNSIHLA
jgi:hypothetical protein